MCPRNSYRDEPNHYFYLFSISAADLKRLTGINRRQRKQALPPEQETAVQRRHIPERSREILRFMKLGFPLSKLSEGKITDTDRKLLQMPGWLPTSILVNIDNRGSKSSVSKNADNDFEIRGQYTNYRSCRLPGQLNRYTVPEIRHNCICLR